MAQLADALGMPVPVTLRTLALRAPWGAVALPPRSEEELAALRVRADAQGWAEFDGEHQDGTVEPRPPVTSDDGQHATIG